MEVLGPAYYAYNVVVGPGPSICEIDCSNDSRREHHCPLIPKYKKEGKQAQITLHPYSNFLESAPI